MKRNRWEYLWVRMIPIVIVACFAYTAPAFGATGSADGSVLSPHLACERALRDVKGLEGRVSETIKSNNIPELLRYLEDISQRLAVARKDMETALLVGAWKSPELKKSGFHLTGQLETVQTLNFISVAFTGGYSNPTGKVRDSVADSTQKMFRELALVLSQVKELNAKTQNKLPETSKNETILKTNSGLSSEAGKR